MSAKRQLLRWVLTVSLPVSAGFLIAAVLLRSFGLVRAQLLLTFGGLAFGAFMTDVHLGAVRRSNHLARIGLTAVAISLISYLLLVWTGWTTQPLIWRIWWISGVWALTSTILLRLRAASALSDPIEQGTRSCIVVLGLMLLGLALHKHLPPDPDPLYLWLGAVPAAGALVGSFIIWRRHLRRSERRGALSRRAGIAWLCVTHAAALLVGWYVGGATAPQRSPFDMLPSALANLSPQDLDTQVRSDLGRLRTISAGVDTLNDQAAEFGSALATKMRVEQRTYFRPQEDDRIRSLFMSYLSYRAALLRMVAMYAGFESVPDSAARARCFTVGYAAAMKTYRASLQLVNTYRDMPPARRKLNEPERQWGIPAGMFDRIYENVMNSRNIELAAEMAAYYEVKRSAWREGATWPANDFDWLDGRIRQDLLYVREHGLGGWGDRMELLLDRVRKDAYTPVYATQSIVSIWIGDTRLVQRPPFISIEQIEQIESRLKPGDILLEQRNWHLSNAFLPGFWPHAALYIGRIEDLRDLKIADDQIVQQHLDEYEQPAPDGRPHTVIESLSDGVIFNSLTESMHADYIAVLRPRLPRKQIAAAIVNAFRHKGKPYDFEFDFFSADKVVCTELIYRAYEGMLHFDLVRVMGRDTLPALEFVHKYVRERATPQQELEFVLFLDAVPEAGRAARQRSSSASASRRHGLIDAPGRTLSHSRASSNTQSFDT